VKKIKMSFGLNNVEILVIDSIHKVLKIGTVVINKLINERFTDNLLFFFLELLLLFDQFIFLDFAVLRTVIRGFTERVDAGNRGVHKVLRWGCDAFVENFLRFTLEKLLNFGPFAHPNLFVDQGVPELDRLCVLKRYIDLSGLLVGLLVGSEKDQGMSAFVFGDSGQIISQVVGFDFGVLFVFDHDLMPAPV
jgi:hypothetical protein